MGNCNVPQKEVGGRSLLLKACKAGTVATTDESSTLTTVAHGLKVGDLISYNSVGALTVVALGVFYFVLSTPTANTYTISATRGGTAIVMDATVASLPVNLFRNFGGLRSKSFTFNSGSIDVTNQDSDDWTQLLDNAGMRNFAVSGSGVYTNVETYQDVFDQVIQNKLVCLMFIDTTIDRIFEGCFKVSSMEVSGDYDAEGQYSMSAESSGPITIQSVA